MAVPTDPTVSGLCTVGLQRGGQYNPSAAQLTLAQDHFLQEVKADIMRIAPNHDHFAALSATPTVRGQQRYDIPTDCNRTQNVVLLSGPTDWQGTAQAGGSTSITLAASFSESDDTLAGKYIALTSGTGSGGYRQITAYNNSAKVATVDTAWATNPASGTTYTIGQEYLTLYPTSFDDHLDRQWLMTGIGKPRRAAFFDQQLYLSPTPDAATYMILHYYYVDISKIDEAGTLFIQLLREWRSLFVQGIAAYTMQRYDDERFPQAWSLYQTELQKLGADTPQYHQTMGYR